MLKRLINKLKKTPIETVPQVETIARSEHGISRTDISENALKVLYRLKKSGYEAHLVGGGVRDLLLGLHPKDFDVVTDASPEEVHKLFKNSRIIGRRFRLVHVTFGRDMIEVATFRGDHGNAEGKHQSKTNESGMLLRDNVYGSIDEDAMRRDFTINALYYNIADFSVSSYAGGIDDIHAKRLRLIGDPATRYREDPVRMLRAARFAAKLGFSIEKATKAPIKELGPLLRDIPPARLFEEVLKLFMAGYAKTTFEQLQALGLFEPLFPHTQQCIDDNKFYRTMLMHALENSDARVAQGKSLTPAFLFSVFLWPCVLETAKLLQQQGASKGQSMQQAMTEIISNQQARTAIPKRFAIPIREIWDLQHRLVARKPKQLETIASHNRFRAAYDFLLLREQSGENLNQAGAFWTQFQNEHPDLIRKAAPKKRSPHKRGASNGQKGRGPRRRA